MVDLALAGMHGPAARTLVLLLPQIGSSPTAPAFSSDEIYKGRPLHEQVHKGLLGYARLLLAQPQGGKLSVLGGTGNQVHTITSWDPGQQSLDSIIKGISAWKILEQELQNIEVAIQEGVQRLLQPSEKSNEDVKPRVTENLVSSAQETTTSPSKSCGVEPWRRASMSRTRLLVMMSHNRGAGGSADIYHQIVLDAFEKIDTRGSDVECCDALFLDVSSSEKDGSSSCVCMSGTYGDIRLATSFYKLPAICSADLLLDLGYFHLELSAIALKGISRVPAQHPKEKGGGRTSGLVKREDIDEGPLEHSLCAETDLRLVLCQASPVAIAGVGCCFTPTGGELRKSRTSFLYRVKKPVSDAQLLALPCSSIIPALLEIPLSRSAAQIWETCKVEEIDPEGNIVLAFSSERDSMHVTHLLVWRLERFWLHGLEMSIGIETPASDAVNGQTLPAYCSEDLADDKAHLRSQETCMSGKVTGTCEKSFLPRKRGLEETEEHVNLPVAPPTLALREKKGSNVCKQGERTSRCYSWTGSESVIGGPERHSVSLTGLLAPIRGVFMSEDPASDKINSASKCVARLLELTEKNDASLFPHAAEIPGARRELYKKMWWELKRLAKRTRKETTPGLEDLAQAIRAARADFKTSEQQLSHPLPPLTEKPTEHVHINKRRRCEEVPRDIHGRPIFPIKLGPSLQVYDLGKVVWNRPAFHSEKYIWPAGYRSRRAYASMLNSENRIFYWCEIVDDGQAPEFRLTPEDDKNNPVIGISPTAVWTVVVKRVGALRLEEGGKKTFANVSGPEYFGFANPTIARLIQQLPNSEKCTKYKRQDYFPNVPMRASELDAWQGVIAHECASSPQTKDGSAAVEEGPTQLRPLKEPAELETEIGNTPAQCGSAVAAEVDEPQVDKENSVGIENDLRGMSWDSEFRKAALRKGKSCLTEFSQHFLVSNSGSLFSYYWLAKSKRAEVIELDGRK